MCGSGMFSTSNRGVDDRSVHDVFDRPLGGVGGRTYHFSAPIDTREIASDSGKATRLVGRPLTEVEQFQCEFHKAHDSPPTAAA